MHHHGFHSFHCSSHCIHIVLNIGQSSGLFFYFIKGWLSSIIGFFIDGSWGSWNLLMCSCHFLKGDKIENFLDNMFLLRKLSSALLLVQKCCRRLGSRILINKKKKLKQIKEHNFKVVRLKLKCLRPLCFHSLSSYYKLVEFSLSFPKSLPLHSFLPLFIEEDLNKYLSSLEWLTKLRTF